MTAMNVVNIMEELVSQKLNDMIAAGGCCTCRQCRDDIYAIALNNLHPRYIATSKGALFTKLERMAVQADTDVTLAVAQAMEIVKANPRHER